MHRGGTSSLTTLATSGIVTTTVTNMIASCFKLPEEPVTKIEKVVGVTIGFGVTVIVEFAVGISESGVNEVDIKLPRPFATALNATGELNPLLALTPT